MTLLERTADHVLSEKSAAETLGISPRTLQRMVLRGEGPTRIKISERRVGYRVSDLERFLRQAASATI